VKRAVLILLPNETGALFPVCLGRSGIGGSHGLDYARSINWDDGWRRGSGGPLWGLWQSIAADAWGLGRSGERCPSVLLGLAVEERVRCCVWIEGRLEARDPAIVVVAGRAELLVGIHSEASDRDTQGFVNRRAESSFDQVANGFDGCGVAGVVENDSLEVAEVPALERSARTQVAAIGDDEALFDVLLLGVCCVLGLRVEPSKNKRPLRATPHAT